MIDLVLHTNITNTHNSPNFVNESKVVDAVQKVAKVSEGDLHPPTLTAFPEFYHLVPRQSVSFGHERQESLAGQPYKQETPPAASTARGARWASPNGGKEYSRGQFYYEKSCSQG